MAVPDTTTFTLNDVVTEVVPTTDDLIDCFSDAVSSKFDSAYSGSKNQLLNFRNYGAVSLTSFTTNSSAQFKPYLACSQSTSTTRYYTGLAFANGSVVWNTSSGTGVPSNGYYTKYSGMSQYSYYLSSGVVSNLTSC